MRCGEDRGTHFGRAGGVASTGNETADLAYQESGADLQVPLEGLGGGCGSGEGGLGCSEEHGGGGDGG
jgi:hypothetical protein